MIAMGNLVVVIRDPGPVLVIEEHITMSSAWLHVVLFLGEPHSMVLRPLVLFLYAPCNILYYV
jgi:hypothetical protein